MFEFELLQNVWTKRVTPILIYLSLSIGLSVLLSSNCIWIYFITYNIEHYKIKNLKIR